VMRIETRMMSDDDDGDVCRAKEMGRGTRHILPPFANLWSRVQPFDKAEGSIGSWGEGENGEDEVSPRKDPETPNDEETVEDVAQCRHGSHGALLLRRESQKK